MCEQFFLMFLVFIFLFFSLDIIKYLKIKTILFKKVICVLTISLLPLNLSGQQSSIIFSRSNLSVFNPAFTGVDGPLLALNSRIQMAGIDQAPTTNFLLYHLPSKKNVHLGISALNDRVFVESKTYLSLDYNYKLKLDQETSIYLGIKAGGFYNNINIEKIPRIFNEPNPLLSTVGSYFNPMFGLGFTIIDPNFFIGIGTPNVFNIKRFQNNGDLEPSARDLTLLHFTGGFKLRLGDKLSVDPLFIYRSISDLPNFISGNLSFVFNDKFSLGTGFSNNDNASVFFGSKYKNGFQWGYGYEFYSGSPKYAINKPTHEIFIRMNLGKNNISEEEETENNDEE